MWYCLWFSFVTLGLLFQHLFPLQISLYSSDKLDVVHLTDFTLKSRRLEFETIISVSNCEIYWQLWTLSTILNDFHLLNWSFKKLPLIVNFPVHFFKILFLEGLVISTNFFSPCAIPLHFNPQSMVWVSV